MKKRCWWLCYVLAMAMSITSMPVPLVAASAAAEVPEKGSVRWVEASRVYLSVGHDWLKKPIWKNPDQIDSMTWDGRTEPDSTLWVEFAAENEDGDVKWGRPDHIEVTYGMIVGGNQPQIGDNVVFAADITYDGPGGTPVYRDPHTSLPLDGALLRLAGWVALREFRQWRTCAWFIAASIAIGVPGAACWNPIWFKELEEAQTFEDQLANTDALLAEIESLKAGFGKHCALPIPINSRYNTGVTIKAQFKAGGRSFPMIRRFEFNLDKDSDTNLTELTNGTDMLDPNDSSQSTLVPNVRNLPIDTAVELFGNRFVVGGVQRIPNAAPENTVLEQNPVGGTRHPVGTAINMVVSNGPSGPTFATVPWLAHLDLTENEARNAILLAGLEVGEVVYEFCDDSDIQQGEVFAQGPAGGLLVEFGTEVNFFVSLGHSPTPCNFPDVVGQIDSAAQAAITANGLSLNGRVVDYFSTGPAWDAAGIWRVYEQDPAGPVVCGSAPYFAVKGGVRVPCDLEGCETAFVISAIEAVPPINGVYLTAQVVSRPYHPSIPANHVISYDYACQDVLAGTCIGIVESAGPQPPNPLCMAYTAPANGAHILSGTLTRFSWSITGGTPPFTVRFLPPNGNAFMEFTTISRTPYADVLLVSSAQPGPSTESGYSQVTDGGGTLFPPAGEDRLTITLTID